MILFSLSSVFLFFVLLVRSCIILKSAWVSGSSLQSSDHFQFWIGSVWVDKGEKRSSYFEISPILIILSFVVVFYNFLLDRNKFFIFGFLVSLFTISQYIICFVCELCLCSVDCVKAEIEEILKIIMERKSLDIRRMRRAERSIVDSRWSRKSILEFLIAEINNPFPNSAEVFFRLLLLME